ncbi:MAG: hypothetical protein IIA54_08675, partial [Chloroflexi bacterium]|nr:hypothetical protein [Chloroflexota bacterium]
MTTPADRVTVVTIRPRLMLEAASEMVGQADWPHKFARISLRDPIGLREGIFSLAATVDPDLIPEVASGAVAVAMLNPSAMLNRAVLGLGPFDRPQKVAAIGVIPSDDQLGFAVTERSGITSLDQIRDEKVPLRVSVRASRDLASETPNDIIKPHGTTLLADEVLKAHGFSLADIESWGGHVSYDLPLPPHPSRIGAVEKGEIDAIFDEALGGWTDRAAAMGMRFLPVEGEPLKKLTAEGFRPAIIEKASYPHLPEDVPTIDFSGWPVYTGSEAPESFVTAFCRALEARKDRIPWEDSGKLPLPLDRMCHDAPDAPLQVPLHPAA